MKKFNGVYHLGWPKNFQFNDFKPGEIEINQKPKERGAVLSIFIAFFIFLSIAFFLSFLNKSIENKNSFKSEKLDSRQTEISLRV